MEQLRVRLRGHFCALFVAVMLSHLLRLMMVDWVPLAVNFGGAVAVWLLYSLLRYGGKTLEDPRWFFLVGGLSTIATLWAWQHNSPLVDPYEYLVIVSPLLAVTVFEATSALWSVAQEHPT